MSSSALLHATDDASATSHNHIGSSSSSSTNVLSGVSATSSSAATASAANSTGGSSSSAAPVVTPASVLDAIKARPEWARAVVFDADARVIAATFKHVDGEIDAWLKLFDKREDTIASGIVLLNEQYDVHRFHPPLVYGRRGDPTTDDSEGICVCRVDRKTQQTHGKASPVFALITYTYPTLSARAAPQLKEFAETQLAYLA